MDDRLAEKNSFDKDGLFKTFHLDSSRSSYEIGGERLFGNDAAPKVVEGLKKLIPNPEHRKVISICMSQAVGLNVTCFAQRIALPGTTKSQAMELAGLKGIEMFMGFPSDDDVIDYYKAFKVNDPSYRIEVSKDGKTATVWAENEGDLRFAMTENDDVTRRIVGGFKWTQKFTFDLSDSSKATLIDAHVGQTIKL